MNHATRWLASLILALAAAPALPHGGEDHSHDAAPALPAGAGARRLADASLYLPKPMQHQLGLRTLLAAAASHPLTLELAGRVIADPNAGGRVQAAQDGRIEPGPHGLPVLGQRVASGQVLAWLRPNIDSVERGGQRAQLAELAAQAAITRGRLARLEQLEGLVPRKEVETARLELVGLMRRRAALNAALNRREPLRAPISGVISAGQVLAGQVVAAGDALFEVVDPARLAVEALAYDPALAGAVEGASARVGETALDLAFVGGGRQLREQALPLLFRVRPPAPVLAVGQPVAVLARTRRALAGHALPRAALTRDAGGAWVVWVHGAPERFAPRQVAFQPLDAARVVVTRGIRDGDRVVSAGASLLAQVR